MAASIGARVRRGQPATGASSHARPDHAAEALDAANKAVAITKTERTA